MFGSLWSFDNDLFQQIERMRRDMDELFGEWEGGAGIRSLGVGSFPPVNIGVSPEQVDVYFFAAGLDQDKLDITIQQNLLTVTGERRTDTPEEAQPFRRERFSGSFRRVVTLPDDVDPEQVTARYREGVLHVTVRRKAVAQPRKIAVSQA